MQVVVDSLLTTYTQVGSGRKSALFLHGWGDSSTTFTMLVAEFTKQNPDYTATLVDLPGFGGTQAPDAAWTLTDYATFVAHFLNKIHIQPQLIIGHSNGGSIAIHGLAQNLFSTDKLILIASAGIRNKSIKKHVLQLVSQPMKIAISILPKASQKRIRHKLYSAIGSDYLVAEHLQATFKNIVSYDVRNEARLVSVPVCLIYGENDSATPPAYGREYNGLIPTSAFTTLPSAGHFVHQEQVYKVATTITEFMHKVTS